MTAVESAEKEWAASHADAAGGGAAGGGPVVAGPGAMGGGSGEERPYHLCIINLVIGTLYCSKGNYAFGLQRVISSLQPYEQKLGPDTWHYAKRCFMGLAESASKHMALLDDDLHAQIVEFLVAAEEAGAGVQAALPQEQKAEEAAAAAEGMVAIGADGSATGAAGGAGTGGGLGMESKEDGEDGEELDGAAALLAAAEAEAAAGAGGLGAKGRTVAQEARMLRMLFLKLREG